MKRLIKTATLMAGVGAMLCFAGCGSSENKPEEVVLMAKNRFRITEVPTQMRCRQGGRSSISPMKSFYYMFKVFFAVLMAALRPATRT